MVGLLNRRRDIKPTVKATETLKKTENKKEEVKDQNPAEKPKESKNGEEAKVDKEVKEVKEAKEAKVVKVKKSIPIWSTLKGKEKEKAGLKVSNSAGNMASIVVKAMEDLIEDNGKPLISSLILKKEVKKLCPKWNKGLVNKAVAKAVEKDRITPVKNSFKLVTKPTVKAKNKNKNKNKSGESKERSGKLEDLLGNIFTWVCEPKEASILLIKKYLEKHYTDLDVGHKFKVAIENAIKKGQLDRINGHGMTGTVQLVDKANKFGTTYEDPIEDAIIACNEPKDASFPALKHYLSEFHTEYNISKRPKVLLHCLEKCEAKGWLQRISGKGMSGSFRLVVPYRPGPRELWGEWYEGDAEQSKAKTRKRSRVESDEEESDEKEESSDEEEVVVPKAKKRGPPTPRKSAPPAKRKKAKAPAKKTKPKRKR